MNLQTFFSYFDIEKIFSFSFTQVKLKLSRGQKVEHFISQKVFHDCLKHCNSIRPASVIGSPIQCWFHQADTKQLKSGPGSSSFLNDNLFSLKPDISFTPSDPSDNENIAGYQW